MAAFRLWDKAAALATIDEMKGAPGAVLPILHALQEEFGFIHAEVTPMLADALNLSRAEIHGTLSFYHDFRHQLPKTMRASSSLSRFVSAGSVELRKRSASSRNAVRRWS